MPRYYFDMHHDEQQTTDSLGLDCPDDEAAQQEAFRSLCDFAHMQMHMRPSDKKEWTYEVQVRSETGPVLKATLTLTAQRL